MYSTLDLLINRLNCNQCLFYYVLDYQDYESNVYFIMFWITQIMKANNYVLFEFINIFYDLKNVFLFSSAEFVLSKS